MNKRIILTFVFVSLMMPNVGAVNLVSHTPSSGFPWLYLDDVPASKQFTINATVDDTTETTIITWNGVNYTYATATAFPRNFTLSVGYNYWQIWVNDSGGSSYQTPNNTVVSYIPIDPAFNDTNWNSVADGILNYSDSGWDDTEITKTSIIWNGTDVALLYIAENSTGAQQGGMAYANYSNLTRFRKHNDNPVFPLVGGTQINTNFAYAHISNGFDGQHLIFASGRNRTYGSQDGITIAYSNNTYGWTDGSEWVSPFRSPDGGSWEISQQYVPSNVLHIPYYCNTSNGHFAGDTPEYLMVYNGADSGSQHRIGRAWSTDKNLTSWTKDPQNPVHGGTGAAQTFHPYIYDVNCTGTIHMYYFRNPGDHYKIYRTTSHDWGANWSTAVVIFDDGKNAVKPSLLMKYGPSKSTFYLSLTSQIGAKYLNTSLFEMNMNTETPSTITINVDSPSNRTYAVNNIELNVSSPDTVDTWWYEYNSNGTNITFTPNTTFVASGADGAKHIIIYANDSGGLVSSQKIYFTHITPNVDPLNLKWWDLRYNSRRTINITNLNDTDSLDGSYTVNLTFNHSELVLNNLSQADGDDIAIVLNQVTQLDRYLCKGSAWNLEDTCIEWMLDAPITPYSINRTYWLYYNNKNAVPKEDPQNVYLVFDNFEGNQFNYAWNNETTPGCPITFSNNQLVISSIDYNGANKCWMWANLGRNITRYRADLEMNFYWNGSAFRMAWLPVTDVSDSGWDYMNNFSAFRRQYSNGSYIMLISENSNAGERGTEILSKNNTWNNYTMKVIDTSKTLIINDSVSSTVYNNTQQVQYFYPFSTLGSGGPDNVENVTINEVRLKLESYTPPEVVLGGEQEALLTFNSPENNTVLNGSTFPFNFTSNYFVWDIVYYSISNGSNRTFCTNCDLGDIVYNATIPAGRFNITFYFINGTVAAQIIDLSYWGVIGNYNITIWDEMKNTYFNLNTEGLNRTKLTLYCSNEEQNYYNITSTGYQINLTCPINSIKVDQFWNFEGNSYAVFRTLVPDYYSGEVRFYMIDLVNNTHAFPKIYINDVSGVYTDGYVTITKLINDTEAIMLAQQLDPQNSIDALLVQNEQYIFSITNSQGINKRILTPKIIRDETEITITIPSSTLIPNQPFMYRNIQYGITVNETLSTVWLFYDDDRNKTNLVNLTLYNATSMELLESYTTTDNQFTRAFTVTDTNTTYLLTMQVEHQEFGNFKDSFTIKFHVIRLINFAGMPQEWYVILGMGLVIAVALLFGNFHSGIGALATGLTGGFVYFIGWFTQINGIDIIGIETMLVTILLGGVSVITNRRGQG